MFPIMSQTITNCHGLLVQYQVEFLLLSFFKKLKAVTIKFIPVSTIQVCHVVSSCSLKESVPFTYSSI